MWGAYFCMGAYKSDVVVIIQMDAYIHGVYFVWVTILFLWYGISYEPMAV